MATLSQNHRPKTSLEILGIPTRTEIRKPSPTEEYLTSLSISLFSLRNDKDLSNPVIDRISPSVTLHHDAGNETLQARGKENLIKALQDATADNPMYHAEAFDSSAIVDEKAGKATVLVLTLLSGLPDGFRKESFGVFTWERKGEEGSWMCTKHRGIRHVSTTSFWHDHLESEGMTRLY